MNIIPPPHWIEDNIRAGVRVLLKRALRASDVPFDGSETTHDLLVMAANTNAQVPGICDEWVELALKQYGLTDMQRWLMERQARRALVLFRAYQAGQERRHYQTNTDPDFAGWDQSQTDPDPL